MLRTDARNDRAGYERSLFEPTVVDTNYVGVLFDRYHDHARAQMKAMLAEQTVLSYDQALLTALQWPMTAEKDVRSWIDEWQLSRELAVEGLAPREQVPTLGKNHGLRWLR